MSGCVWLVTLLACGPGPSTSSDGVTTDPVDATEASTSSDASASTAGTSDPGTSGSSDPSSSSDPSGPTDATTGTTAPPGTDTATTAGEGDEILCMRTGGVWVEETCGHYVCGEPPGDLCLMPGCDCGPEANFGPDGCADDMLCFEDKECATWRDCHKSQLCAMGCCDAHDGFCPGPLIEVSPQQNPGCTIQTEFMSSLRVYTECGLWWDHVDDCATEDGVEWVQGDMGLAVNLCGAACDSFLQNGAELFGFCGE